jgi:hypothetical protein
VPQPGGRPRQNKRLKEQFEVSDPQLMHCAFQCCENWTEMLDNFGRKFVTRTYPISQSRQRLNSL